MNENQTGNQTRSCCFMVWVVTTSKDKQGEFTCLCKSSVHIYYACELGSFVCHFGQNNLSNGWKKSTDCCDFTEMNWYWYFHYKCCWILSLTNKWARVTKKKCQNVLWKLVTLLLRHNIFLCCWSVLFIMFLTYKTIYITSLCCSSVVLYLVVYWQSNVCLYRSGV